jgi:hypothetical protein
VKTHVLLEGMMQERGKKKKNIYIYIYYTISQNSPDYDNCP